MSLLRVIPVMSLCALAFGAAQATDVYKHVDEHGNVLYTDKPRTLPAERLNVQSRKTDVVAVQERQAEEMQRMQQASSSRQEAAQQRTDDRRSAEQSAQEKAERCTKARERYDTYMNSQRLYESLPDGERRYLSDTELDATRAAAKASMDELCK